MGESFNVLVIIVHALQRSVFNIWEVAMGAVKENNDYYQYIPDCHKYKLQCNEKTIIQSITNRHECRQHTFNSTTSGYI